jgi:hypothetical protein
VSWPRLAAWVVTVITAVVLSADVWVVTIAGRAADRWLVLLALVVSTGSTALGLLVARRQPANWVGTLLCAMGGVFALNIVRDIYPVAPARRAAEPSLAMGSGRPRRGGVDRAVAPAAAARAVRTAVRRRRARLRRTV